MCGISALIGLECAIELLQSLKQLQNRGYDSAGIATIIDNTIECVKYASDVNESALVKLQGGLKTVGESTIGIAHTRWATHGAKSDCNSHPHISFDNQFAVVHNGIIENFSELKTMLIADGVDFKSDTDTEIIVNLLAVNYQKCLLVADSRDATALTENAIKLTLRQLEGTWALVIMNVDTPETLYCTRRGSPLLVSINDSHSMITSEVAGFCGKEFNYIILDNHDLCTIERRDGLITVTTEGDYELLKNVRTEFQLSPGIHPHWTIKEIYEQYESSRRAISFGGRLLEGGVKLGGLDNNRNHLNDIENIILLGCGTSYFAGCVGKKYFRDLCDFNTLQVIDGSEFTHKDIPKIGKTVLILLSQSGETKDLHRCIQIGNTYNLFQIGVVNVPDSQIAREVGCGCYLNAGREVGVASTKSFTSQIIVLSMIAMWFSQTYNIHNALRGDYINCLRKLPYDIKTLLENCPKQIAGLPQLFLNNASTFILGKGDTIPVAMEAALKIKELCYIHAEGYSSSSLKHGPLALLRKDFPVIIIALDTEFYSKVLNAYEEIKSRHGAIIFVTNIPTDKANSVIIPHNDYYSELLAIVPLQLLAYNISVLKGHNPDMPKNLAKVVTVE